MKFKKFFLSLLIFYVSVVAFAQTEVYYVVHLKGNITNTVTKKALKIGDKLNANDKIEYNPDLASAVVMSSQKGRFMLGKPAGQTASKTGTFLAYVRNTMMPVRSNGQLSTRGVEMEPVKNLKDVFGDLS
ncbi:MAG: hypothetical protein H7Y04_00940, partial [Verrucomicrobia bacterium]|nr:hypothetical protein [Cytophagales bacterium]